MLLGQFLKNRIIGKMIEFQAEIANPNPKSTINSYRSFGYNLSTAVADILDNSISAKSNIIEIESFWNGKDSYLYFLDNGLGMNLEELIIAMTPGSKDPEEERNENDLGRFGLGLKTASFSQCKRLTVITKKKGYKTIKRCWDIDFINEQQKWLLLDYVSDSKFLDILDKYENGTIVLWEKLDRIVGDSNINNEMVKSAFYQELSTVKDHLGLVFHKFIESKKLKLIFNTYEIESYNPFLLNLYPLPRRGQTEVFEGNVEVTYYILPHMSSIDLDLYEKTGGPLGWYNQQGFYIYRGERLLVAGDWLGLENKKEYSKLARIEIKFPNQNDFDWQLDIKKSTANPPLSIRRELVRIAKISIKESARIYNYRGQHSSINIGTGQVVEKLWFDEFNSERIKKYKINRKHPLIKELLNNKEVGRLFRKALKIIEENIPLDLILYNQNEDPSFHELEKKLEIPSDELIQLAVDLFKIYLSQGVPKELARQQIMNAVPFNLFPSISTYL